MSDVDRIPLKSPFLGFPIQAHLLGGFFPYQFATQIRHTCVVTICGSPIKPKAFCLSYKISLAVTTPYKSAKDMTDINCLSLVLFTILFDKLDTMERGKMKAKMQR